MDKLNISLLIITTFFISTQTAFFKPQVTIGSDQRILVFHIDGYDFNQAKAVYSFSTAARATMKY